MRFAQVILAAGLAVLLVACGDNPSDALPAPPEVSSNEVPASATANVTSYTQYAGSLAKTETGQPLDVNKVVPPTSETALPDPVN